MQRAAKHLARIVADVRKLLRHARCFAARCMTGEMGVVIDEKIDYFLPNIAPTGLPVVGVGA